MPEIEIQQSHGGTERGSWPSMKEIRRELRQMMREFFSGHWLHLPGRSRTESVQDSQPEVSMHGRGSDLVVETALPGLDKKDVHVTVTCDRLTIWGDYQREENTQKGRVFLFEMRRGSFYRSLALPAEVNTTLTRAELKDGMLRIHLPLLHPEADAPRQVEIH